MIIIHKFIIHLNQLNLVESFIFKMIKQSDLSNSNMILHFCLHISMKLDYILNFANLN